ncbi:hypothetical protein UlMin_037638 [Ulmus minor]
MGRRKIEIKLVKDSSCRQVTFSKRRTGLFKKANEIATLCGAEVAIIMFSPGGKPYSFGQPDVNSIAEKFLNKKSKIDDLGEGNNSEIEGVAKVDKLHKQFTKLKKNVKDEKKCEKILEKEIKEGKDLLFDGKASIDELSFDELLKMKGSLEKLGEKVKEHVAELEMSSILLLLSKKPI